MVQHLNILLIDLLIECFS